MVIQPTARNGDGTPMQRPLLLTLVALGSPTWRYLFAAEAA
jgi:hypothetical protein